MSITLRQLRQFVAISECGSFRGAAERLFTAQPALSISIQRLEANVGTPLFVRGPRGVTLTLAGDMFLKNARSALFYVDQARHSAREIALGESGTLRLGFVGSATYEMLPLCVPAFSARYPGVQVQLREQTTVGLLDLLRSHEIDAGLVRGPIRDDSDFRSWELQQDDVILAVSVSHDFARRKVVRLEDCRDEPFVMYAQHDVPGLYSTAMSLCRNAGFSPRIRQEAIQVQTVVSLVASGMGVALVPGVTRSYSTQHVRFIDLHDKVTKKCLSLSLVTHKDTDHVLVRHFKDCARHTLAGS